MYIYIYMHIDALVKNLPSNTGDARDSGSIPRLRRSPGGGNGNLLQYSCLENPMDREVCQATIHGITKSQTGLSDLTLALCVCVCVCVYIYNVYIMYIHIYVCI